MDRIDKKFAELGFEKVSDDKYGVIYERKNLIYEYTQVLAILHKASGQHIIQSYDKDLMDHEKLGNVCVGLNYYEAKLALKKMKKIGLKSK